MCLTNIVMGKIPSRPPTIKPLNGISKRPFWSVMIPVFNNGQYLEETLTSVLSQSVHPDKMQVEVVDDASSDIDVESLVKNIGKGRVSYYRHNENVGNLRNFETCLNRAKGHWIHLLHGDDKVHQSFYSKMEHLITQFPEIGAAICRYRCIESDGKLRYIKSKEMNEPGLLQNWFYKIAIHQRTQYAAIVVKRDVYENLGSFYGNNYGEDWEMWVRIARYFPLAYTPEILADYRVHNGSLSGKKLVTGEYLQDLKEIIFRIQQYIPSEMRATFKAESIRYYAKYGLKEADRIWKHTRNKNYTIVNISKSLDLYYGMSTLLPALLLRIKMSLWK
jgi:glycosyltransferase involved in cell wall biosynthesis